MPIQACEVKGPNGTKPGVKWGNSGKCYTYDPNDERSKKRAESRAKAQASAAYAHGYKGEPR